MWSSATISKRHGWVLSPLGAQRARSRTCRRMPLFICSPGVLQPQLLFCNGDGESIDEIVISAWPPGMGELVAVTVVLDTVRRGPDLSTFEQYLERFSGGNASTELAGHDGRGATSFLEIDAGLVGQIVAVQQRGSKTDQETNGFFQFRSSGYLEIVF